MLIDWNPRYLYRRLLDDDTQIEHFLSEVCSRSWNEELDRGRPFADAVAALSAAFPQHAQHINAYHTCWGEMLGGPIADTVTILEALRTRGYPLHALTNWSAETFPIAQARYPFLDYFGEIVVSGREGLIKPQPEIFELLLQRITTTADRCLFIDDSFPNIQAAATLGFDTVHFQSPAQLREALRARDLLE